MTYEPGVVDYEDFKQTTEPVWLLGSKYSSLYGECNIKNTLFPSLTPFKSQ